MTDYIMVETRDFLETRDTEWVSSLACRLNRKHDNAALFLTENGALAARAAYDAQPLRQLTKKGVRVFVDSFALKERGIDLRDLPKGVEIADIGFLTDKMAAGAAVIWR